MLTRGDLVGVVEPRVANVSNALHVTQLALGVQKGVILRVSVWRVKPMSN